MLAAINRIAFLNHTINLPNHNSRFLGECIWLGPKGFSSKPALCSIYGHELDRLFRDILKVPNATSAEALKYLEELKHGESTTITDVAEVYVFLQEHYADK